MKRLLLSFVIALVTLLVLEGAVRVFDLGPPRRPTAEGADTMPSKDPILIFENRPNGKRTTILYESDGSERVVVHAINSLGLRGPETTRSKPSGIFRIAILGDSFTFGHGVNNHETWPAALQRALDRDHGEGRFEVLNFAVPAYDSEQEVRQLGTQVLPFDPDLVLLAWYLNDPAMRGGGHGLEFEEPPALVRLLNPKQTGFIAGLRSVSRLAETIADGLYRASHQAYLPTTFNQLYDEESDGWRRSKAALRRAQDLLGAHHIPFVIVMYPTLTEHGEHLVSHAAYAKVASYCEAREIPCLDLEPVFLGQSMPSLRVHRYDSHPNGRAHTMAAEAVANWLMEEGTLGG